MLPYSQREVRILQRCFFCILTLGMLVTACNPTPTSTVQVSTAPDKTQPVEDPSTVTPLPPTAVQTGKPATPAPSATIPVELSKLADTRIRVIHPWTGQAGIEFRKLIDEFNQENVWKIQVDEVQGGSVSEISRLFTDSQGSSEHIDLTATSPEYLAAWFASGQILDLSAFISHPEWGISDKVKETFNPAMWKANMLESQQIGIPAQINMQFLVYNQTWAEELGFSEAPATQQDFSQQVCQAAIANNQDAKKENDGTGGWIINSSSPTLLSWINAFDGSRNWVTDPLKAIDQTETGDAFSYLRSLMEKGCAWNSRVASPFTYFSDRQALAFSASLPDLLELEETLSFTKNTDKWTILPYPGAEKSEPVLMSGLSYGISKSEPVRELAAWLFLRWLMIPRNQARLSEAAGTIPPTSAAIDLLETTSVNPAWWQEAQSMVSDAVILPASSDWRQIRPVLEDGFWQMLQPTPVAIPTLLYQMNETVKAAH